MPDQRKRTTNALLVSLVALAISLFGNVVGWNSQRQSINRDHKTLVEIIDTRYTSCLAGNDTRASILEIFNSFEAQIMAQPMTEAQRARTQLFFDNALGPEKTRATEGPFAARVCVKPTKGT